MKRSIILTTAFLPVMMMLMTACDWLLEPEPSQSVSQEVALTTDANVKSVLNGAYSLFNEPGIYGGNILRNAELLAGNGEIMWVNEETYYEPYEFFTKTISPENQEVYIQWRDSYRVINAVNNVISALDVVKPSDRPWVEGEALFLRALVYFDLVRFFALPYEAGAVNNQYGVPLVLEPVHVINDDIYKGRSTVEEVYSQIIRDLTIAVERLPDENGIFATRGAALALLARVYLQKGDYDNARNAASAVISSGKYSLLPVYSDVFNRAEPTKEDIFVAKISYPQEYNAMTVSFSSSAYGGNGFIEILDGHITLYPEGDKRAELFYTGDDALRCGKWNNINGCVNLIRFAEMFLIRAECNLRLGPPYKGADPVDDYNVVHRRAGLPAAGLVSLDEIILERRRELAFEGHRIHDIKRLKQSIGVWGYKNPKLLFPVPAREIRNNPALKSQQNEGYQ